MRIGELRKRLPELGTEAKSEQYKILQNFIFGKEDEAQFNYQDFIEYKSFEEKQTLEDKAEEVPPQLQLLLRELENPTLAAIESCRKKLKEWRTKIQGRHDPKQDQSDSLYQQYSSQSLRELVKALEAVQLELDKTPEKSTANQMVADYVRELEALQGIVKDFPYGEMVSKEGRNEGGRGLEFLEEQLSGYLAVNKQLLVVKEGDAGRSEEYKGLGR